MISGLRCGNLAQEGPKVLLLLPVSESELLKKCQGPFERQGSTDCVKQLPSGGLKSFHVNLLKAWLEDEDVGVSYGQEWNWPSSHEDQGAAGQDYPLSPVQRSQVAGQLWNFQMCLWISQRFLGVGNIKITHTHTKVVVRTPLRPIPLALQQILQQKVDKGLQIRVTEPLEKSPSVSTQAGWLSECLSTLMSVMLTYASD